MDLGSIDSDAGNKSPVEIVKKWFFLALELGKIRITFSVAITTTVGYLLAPRPWEAHLFWPVAGILLIGLSSAALNQLQDRHLDAKMKRTRHRPLPSGRVTPKQALVFVLITFVLGTGILALETNWIATVLGVSALVWYNAIYTYLKRVSSIAVIPGSVIGGIPPVVGWVAAGGDLFDPLILSIGLFVVIWQIPHFWLLLFLYGKDYSLAGLPTLLDHVSEYGLRLLTFGGLLVTVISATWIPYAGDMTSKEIYRILTVLSVLMLFFSRKLLTRKSEIDYRGAFISINVYSVLVLLLVLAAGLWENL